MDPQWILLGSTTGIELQTNVVYNPNLIELILGHKLLIEQTTTIGFNPKRRFQRADPQPTRVGLVRSNTKTAQNHQMDLAVSNVL